MIVERQPWRQALASLDASVLRANTRLCDDLRAVFTYLRKHPARTHQFLAIKEALDLSHVRVRDALTMLQIAGAVKRVGMQGYGAYRLTSTFERGSPLVLKEDPVERIVAELESRRPHEPTPATIPIALVAQPDPTPPPTALDPEPEATAPPERNLLYQVVYEAIRAHPGATPLELAAHLPGPTQPQITSACSKLAKRGVVRRERSGKLFRYWLADGAPASLPSTRRRMLYAAGELEKLVMLTLEEWPGSCVYEVAEHSGVEPVHLSPSLSHLYAAKRLRRESGARAPMTGRPVFRYWLADDQRPRREPEPRPEPRVESPREEFAALPPPVDAEIEAEAQAMVERAREREEAERAVAEAQRKQRIRDLAIKLAKERGIDPRFLDIT